MKYLIGAVIAVGVMFSGQVFAAGPMIEVWPHTFKVRTGSSGYNVHRFIDEDYGTLCYLTEEVGYGYGKTGVSISCLKQ